MFDTYQVGPSRVYHDHNTRITENRAPTDESVRLLKEFGDAARDQIVGVIRNKNNGIDFTAHVFNEADNPFDTLVRIRCSVNGRMIDFTTTTPRHADKKQLAEFIIDKLAQAIARELITTNFSKLEGVFK